MAALQRCNMPARELAGWPGTVDAPTGCTSNSMPLAASASLMGSARPLRPGRPGGHGEA